MKKTLAAIILMLVSICCFSEENVEKKNGEKKRLTVSISTGIPMLHPHISFNADEAQMLTALYEGLVVYDPYTLQPVPAIAEKWSVTGGRTWRFTLRKNAKFENGDPITAKTFVDAWLNLLTPGAGYQYASLLDCIDGAADYRTGKLKNKEQVGIKAESEYVLLVYTNSPSEHLPNILCHHAFSAVYGNQLKEAGQLVKQSGFDSAKKAFKPVSSGAYKISRFTDGEIFLEKNENYWDTASVQIPEISLILNLQEESAAEKFNKGEIDWLSRADVLSKIGDSRYIHIDPLFATEYFFFKTSSQKTKNKEFRKALLLAIPYEELRNGYLIQASSLIFPLVGYPEVEGITEYNVYKAEQLINELKLTEDEKSLIIKLPDTAYYKELFKILKNAWGKIGIKTEAVFSSFAKYYDELKTEDYNLGIISWIGDFADPLAFLEMFRPKSTLNDSGWSNTEFEQMLRRAGSETQVTKRYGYLAKAEQLLLDEGVVIPISHNTSVNIIDTFSIGGWFSNAIDIHPFKFIKFSSPQPIPGIVKNYLKK
nr:peptide ABC transporter substrate-binding protein [Treponema pedis]